MKFYRARIATRGVSGAGSPSRRVRRGPRGAAPPPVVGGAAGLGATRPRHGTPHARHQPRLAADRWHAPSASRDTHLPKLPGRERAAGFLEVLEGDTGKMRGSTENARRRNDRVARLDAPRGGGFTRTTNVLNLALRRGSFPLRASMTRVDARRDRARRASANGRWRGFARRSRRFLLPRRARDGWGSRCVRRPSRRRVRRGRGWDGASRRRGGGGDGGEGARGAGSGGSRREAATRPRGRCARPAAESTAVRVSIRVGRVRAETRWDARARGGVRGARG